MILLLIKMKWNCLVSISYKKYLYFRCIIIKHFASDIFRKFSKEATLRRPATLTYLTKFYIDVLESWTEGLRALHSPHPPPFLPPFAYLFSIHILNKLILKFLFCFGLGLILMVTVTIIVLFHTPPNYLTRLSQVTVIRYL